MAGDSFQEVTYENWFTRMKNSIGGMVVGFILFLVSFVLLFWNEGRAVDTARSLDEAKGVVVSVASDKVDAANDGKLVHMTGKATSTETLTDDYFGEAVVGIRLIRTVEMFQWEETKESKSQNKVGGGQQTVTTYKYNTVWSSKPISSNDFKEPTGHINPGGDWPVSSAKVEAKEVTLGAFTLTPAQVGMITGAEKLPVTEDDYKKMSEDRKKAWKLTEGGLYRGENPSNPVVGDMRVRFDVLKPQTISIMAEQRGKTFQPYQPKSASATINMVTPGDKSAKEMISSAEEGNKILTWILRLVGFVLMGVGIYLVLAPAQMFANILPFLGGLVGFALGAFSCVCAGSLSMVTIGVAWLFYRPLLGIALLVVAGLGAVGLVWIVRKMRKPAAKAS